MRHRFTTDELPLAAFLRSQGHRSHLLPPPDPRGYFTFAFEGDAQELEALAEAFARGAVAPALQFYQALNGLRAEIRYARGGWR